VICHWCKRPTENQEWHYKLAIRMERVLVEDPYTIEGEQHETKTLCVQCYSLFSRGLVSWEDH